MESDRLYQHFFLNNSRHEPGPNILLDKDYELFQDTDRRIPEETALSMNQKLQTHNQLARLSLCTVRGVLKGTQKWKPVLENHLTGPKAQTPCSETTGLAQETHSKGERGQADCSQLSPLSKQALHKSLQNPTVDIKHSQMEELDFSYQNSCPYEWNCLEWLGKKGTPKLVSLFCS